MLIPLCIGSVLAERGICRLAGAILFRLILVRSIPLMRAHLGFSLFVSALSFCMPVSSTYAQHSMPGGSAAVDANGVRHTWSAGSPKQTPWEADIAKLVPPQYPYEARRFRKEGSGLFRLQLDVATGKVIKATVLRSTGVVMLDNSALWALRRWEMKPGRWRELDIPISFSLSPPRPLPSR
jgi:TonB family protein